MNLSRAAVLYLWLTVAVAAAFFGYWLRAWAAPPSDSPAGGGLVALFVLLAILAVHFPIELLPKHKVNLAAAVYFAALLLFGVPAAMLVVGLGQLLGGGLRVLRSYRDLATRLGSVRGLLFNAGQVMTAVGLSGLVYFSLLPQQAPAPLARVENLWALPMAATVLYGANTLAVALMVGLQRRQNPVQVWLSGRRLDALQFGALYPLGVVCALTTTHYPWAPLVMILPAVVIYVSLKRNLELLARVEELARREAEEAALRRLDELKTELMSTISHELRTPLTVIHGYASRLAHRVRSQRLDGDTIQKTAERILASSAQMTRLIQDLGDFSRMERGEVAVQAHIFDLVPTLDHVLAGFRIQPGGARLRADLPASLSVHADETRIVQVVANLVDNALKYAPHGPIVVHARRTGAVARVEVQDHGSGIPDDEQPHLWQKFVRGKDVAGYNVARGTGIGLAVVKMLVEAQGGRVGVNSAPGKGACFWFELPSAPAAVQAGAPAGQPGTARTTSPSAA